MLTIVRKTIVLGLILTAVSVSVSSQNNHQIPLRPQGFVSDFAANLSPMFKQTLESKLKQFAERDGIDFAVVTIQFDEMHGQPIEEFSRELGRSWGVGRGPDKLGLILLIAVKESCASCPFRGATRLEVSRKLESTISNQLALEIIQSMRNDLMSGRFDAAVSRGVEQIISNVQNRWKSKNPPKY